MIWEENRLKDLSRRDPVIYFFKLLIIFNILNDNCWCKCKCVKGELEYSSHGNNVVFDICSRGRRGDHSLYQVWVNNSRLDG